MFYSCKQQFLYYPVIIFITWNLPSGSFNLTIRASLSWQGVVLCNILNKFENKKTKSRRVSNLFFARCADDHKTSDSKVLISYLWLWHLVPQITSSLFRPACVGRTSKNSSEGPNDTEFEVEYGAMIVFVSVSY